MHHKSILKEIFDCFFRLLSPIVFLGLLFVLSYLAYKEYKGERELQNKMMRVTVVQPKFKPTPSQENLNLAMALYSIDVPEYLDGPYFDSELDLRGLILGYTFNKNRRVFVGSEAFSSFGLLGSTLAHEIEVHGNQSFIFAEILNQFGNGLRKLCFLSFVKIPNNFGYHLAENEAYHFEAQSHTRFLLTQKEVEGILLTLQKIQALDNEL